MSKKKTICLTGGGSGGHIYPALAIAEELELLDPELEMILVGAKRGLERKLFKKTKYKSYFLPVGQLHSSVGRLKQIWSLVKMPFCFLISFWILLKHKPSVVMGVGGYASGPLCIVSVFLKIPTFVWEGNATPGVTNRILGKFKITPFLVFEEASKFFKKVKPITTGVPVRKALESVETQNTKKPSKLFNVLFVGGSQGARIFNDTLPELSKNYSLEPFRIIHQTGFKNYEQVLKDYGSNKKDNIEVLSYLDPIREFYVNADLVVSRSGAGAVNELSLLGKASILVPFPKASDDHQMKNAEALVSKKSAILLKEEDFTAEKLNDLLVGLREDPSQLSALSANIQKSLKRGAREQIAAHLFKFL